MYLCHLSLVITIAVTSITYNWILSSSGKIDQLGDCSTDSQLKSSIEFQWLTESSRFARLNSSAFSQYSLYKNKVISFLENISWMLSSTCCMGRNDKRSNLQLWHDCRYEDKSRTLYFCVCAFVDNQQQMLNESSLLEKQMSGLALQ